MPSAYLHTAVKNIMYVNNTGESRMNRESVNGYHLFPLLEGGLVEKARVIRTIIQGIPAIERAGVRRIWERDVH